MIKILLIVGINFFQTWFGYLENKILGAILPVTSIILYIYLLVNGYLSFGFITIIMPFIGLFALISLWETGKKTKKDKQKKEIDKMKAKDRQ